MNRRKFLSVSVGAACAMATIPAAAEASHQLRVALIGCGPRGLALTDTVIRAGGCQITATFDADPALTQAAAARYGATSYTSLRELLASDSPEVAIINGRVETVGISELLRAGTHLFLDTLPAVSAEGRAALRKAVESFGRVVQVNFDGPGLARCPEAAALLRSGRIGPVNSVRAHVHHYHPSKPRTASGAMLGWAGEILAFSGEKSPRRVTATGHQQHQVVTWEFEGLTAIWEQRVFTSTAEERVSTGATWYGSAGVLRVDGDSWRLVSHGDARDEHRMISARDRDAACWSEFLRAIREQRQPRRSLDLALNAAEMVRLAECSRRLERPLEWDAQRGTVVRDVGADRLLRATPEWQA